VCAGWVVGAWEAAGSLSLFKFGPGRGVWAHWHPPAVRDCLRSGLPGAVRPGGKACLRAEAGCVCGVGCWCLGSSWEFEFVQVWARRVWGCCWCLGSSGEFEFVQVCCFGLPEKTFLKNVQVPPLNHRVTLSGRPLVHHVRYPCAHAKRCKGIQSEYSSQCFHGNPDRFSFFFGEWALHWLWGHQ